MHMSDQVGVRRLSQHAGSTRLAYGVTHLLLCIGLVGTKDFMAPGAFANHEVTIPFICCLSNKTPDLSPVRSSPTVFTPVPSRPYLFVPR